MLVGWQVNVTKAELAGTVSGRGAQNLPVVEGWKDGALTVFIPGTPKHYKGKLDAWDATKHTKRWREATANRLYEHRLFKVPGAPTWPWPATDRKRVDFMVYGVNRFDSDDNLRLVCSPVKDALGPSGARKHGVGLLDDDRDSSHHDFHYDQSPSRKKDAVLGIAVTIRVAP